MSYTPGDIFEQMGRHWHLEDEFQYSLDPRYCYSTNGMETMRREYEF